MDNPLNVDVSFKDEAPEEVMAILNEIGAEQVEQVQQRALTGVEFVVLAILAANALANLVIKLLPLWKCGVVVDARGPRVLTRKNCDLPRGTVLVIHKDGTETKLHKPSGLELASLISKLFPGKAP
jgi:hypothetical protein